MLTVSLARQLRDAGLLWTPQRGDRFVVADRGMDDEIFVLSDMTIEVHQHASGPIIGFNGTTEWALDSLEQDQALWVPDEHQLRDLLGAAFVRLVRSADDYRVTLSRGGRERTVVAATAGEAYGLALLDVLRDVLRDVPDAQQSDGQAEWPV